MTPEHKPSDLYLWARACERVGKGGMQCRPRARLGLRFLEPCAHGQLANHQVYWPIGDAECVVAMLEWLIRERHKFTLGKTPNVGYYLDVPRAFSQPTLPLALAAAVVAVPKEPGHAE
jgi:hypothetical protein